MSKFIVSIGGVEKKLVSSRLSAIKSAKEMSLDKASDYAKWAQPAQVKSDFEVLNFENGKKISSVKLPKSNEDWHYY